MKAVIIVAIDFFGHETDTRMLTSVIYVLNYMKRNDNCVNNRIIGKFVLNYMLAKENPKRENQI